MKIVSLLCQKKWLRRQFSSNLKRVLSDAFSARIGGGVLIFAPRLKSWNLRSGISSPKPTGCCLGDLEADLKIALFSQIGQSTVIFWWFDGITVEDQENDVLFSHPSTTIRSSWPKTSSELRPSGWMSALYYFLKVLKLLKAGMRFGLSDGGWRMSSHSRSFTITKKRLSAYRVIL